MCLFLLIHFFISIYSRLLVHILFLLYDRLNVGNYGYVVKIISTSIDDISKGF